MPVTRLQYYACFRQWRFLAFNPSADVLDRKWDVTQRTCDPEVQDGSQFVADSLPPAESRITISNRYRDD
ncbi:hypothetical protein BaRGS_00007926 [Batillaria attramentaria]|uniref:Uncharacterized protein n=1 Tax=Batillaria attramentaria TaxID=370345 RepID=A0ABD0LNQ6_9CAEN